MRSELSDELAQVFCEEGLREACFDAEFPRDVVSGTAGAQENDGHIFMPPPPPELSEERLAILDGEHQIDDHQVGELHLALLQGRLDVARSNHGVPVLLEQDLEHVAKRGIVIENEDGLLRGHIRIVTGCLAIANMCNQPTLELLRSPRMRWAFVAMLLSILCLASCAHRSVGSEPDEPSELPSFYPMRAGNAWSYDVDTGEPSTTLAVTRVEAFDGRVAVVRTGEGIVQYEVSSDGIRLLSEDAWLFRHPLEAGARWPARGGRSAELVSTDAGMSTPAGTFEGCIEVLERGGELDLEVRTLYCPDVGPIFVASTLRSEISDRSLTVSARLRGYALNPSTEPVR